MLCGVNFPTRYDRIETDRVRSLGFVFSSAEAAPTDTVQVRSYYAGEEVDSVRWRVSLDYRFTLMGNDTALAAVSLDTIAVPGSDTLKTGVGGFYDYATVGFVVPRDVIRNAAIIPEDWHTLLPEEIQDSIPDQVRSLTKDDMIDFLESVAFADSATLAALATPSSQGPGAGAVSGDSTFSIMALTGMLAQLFTTEIIVYADAFSGGYEYNTRFAYTIRYNRLLREKLAVLGVAENTISYNINPKVGWIGIYKVDKDSLFSFDPLENTGYGYTLYRLYKDTTLGDWASGPVGGDSTKVILDADTIPIDKGYSYFLAADSAIEHLDTVIVATTQKIDTSAENLYYDWFYQPEPVPGVHPDSIMILNNANRASTAYIFPPVNDTQSSYPFSVWLMAYDQSLGDRLRPNGFAYAAARGVLKMTEEYRRALKKSPAPGLSQPE